PATRAACARRRSSSGTSAPTPGRPASRSREAPATFLSAARLPKDAAPVVYTGQSYKPFKLGTRVRIPAGAYERGRTLQAGFGRRTLGNPASESRQERRSGG